MKKYQTGYTAIELAIAIGGISVIAIMVGVVYIAVHFIQKFW